MNEAFDPLEEELSALRPHDVSPALRQSIADCRARTASFGSRWAWRLAVTAGLTAACVAAVIVLNQLTRPRAEPKSNVAGVDSPSVEFEAASPTLLAYQRALARSPEELDALLNKHAVIAPESNAARVRLCAFDRSYATLNALLEDD